MTNPTSDHYQYSSIHTENGDIDIHWLRKPDNTTGFIAFQGVSIDEQKRRSVVVLRNLDSGDWISPVTGSLKADFLDARDVSPTSSPARTITEWFIDHPGETMMAGDCISKSMN